MTHPSWAIVTGAIRDPLEFKINLAHLIRLRDTGALDGIILSTWLGEIDRHSGLRHALRALGVDVVECRDPSDPGPGNCFRQHKSFYEGLCLAPESATVVRWRTDKVMWLLPYLETTLRARETDEAEPSAAPFDVSPFAVFEKPLTVPSVAMSYPFHHMDMVILGEARDLRRIVNFDHRFAMIYGADAAEIRWFAPPFLSRCPLFDVLFRVTNGYGLSEALVFHARVAQERFRLPPFLNTMFAAYLLYCAANFRSFLPPSAPSDGRTSLHLSELFAPARVGCQWPEMRYTSIGAEFWSASVVARVLSGGLAESEGATELLDAVARIRDGGVPRFEVEQVREELRRWVREARVPAAIFATDAAQVTRAERAVSVGGFHPALDILKAEDDVPATGDDERLETFLEASDSGMSLYKAGVAIAERFHCGPEEGRDAAKAVVWWKRAIAWGAKGDTAYRLAQAYMKGDGVPQDIHAALHHLRLAAITGSIEAQYEFGLCSIEGFSTPLDLKGGAFWVHSAATQGHPPAQRLLARCYEEGIGVDPDSATAEYWRIRAGDADATIELENVG